MRLCVFGHRRTLITFFCFLFCRHLQVTELLGQAWSKPKTKHRAPNVLQLAHQFNDTAGWVTTSVLAFDRARARARVISKFIGMSFPTYFFPFTHHLMA